MHPTLFQVGSFKLPSFGAMMVVAFMVSLFILRKRAPKFSITPDEASDISFWAILGGILGARLFFIIQDLPSYLKNPSQLLTLQFQGLTSFGGFIIGGLAAVIACRKKGLNVMNYLDTVGPAFLIGHAIGRIGCMLNGCCHGHPSDHAFPFSVYSAEARCLTAPAQLYDSLMNVIAFGLVYFLTKRSVKPGFVFGITFFLHGITRFIYEIFRAGSSSTTVGGSWFTEGQIMALVVSLAGLALALWKTKAVVTQEVTP